jgi:RNA polymerase-binding transcription factor DksA
MSDIQVTDWQMKCKEILENDLLRREAALNAPFADSVQRSIEMHMAHRINSALERFEDGSWGICDRCQKPIGEDRLMAWPYAELCKDCQDDWDKRFSSVCYRSYDRGLL